MPRASSLFGIAVLVAILGLAAFPAVNASGWGALDAVLTKGVADGVTPGLQALVADHTGVIYHKTFGNFTYHDIPPFNHHNPPVTFKTTYDMASLTKVLATTTATMLLYDKDLIHLDTPLADPTLLGPQFAQNGKAAITVRNLLLHNAGYPPDPVPGYQEKVFGCPESSHYHPKLSFSCVPKIYNSVLHQTLINPVGQVYIYSDLSMITLAFALGHVVQAHGLVHPTDLLHSCAQGLVGEPAWHCYFEAFVRTKVVNKLGMGLSGFLIPRHQYPTAAPTWNDTIYRHEVLQGVVSDDNAYALGGYAGHAGFWSNALDTYHLTKELMFGDGTYIRRSTVELFTKAYNLTQSSRALGWDTNDYTMNTYRGCNTLSPLTYTHLGYTGTETCNDPTRKLITILLTNRTYPGKTTSSATIKLLRQAFNKNVQEIFDSGHFTPEFKESAFFLKR